MRKQVQRVLKPICALLTLTCCLLFSTFGYVKTQIPDSVLYTEKADMLINGIFPVKAVYSDRVGRVQGSEINTETEYEADMKLFGIFPISRVTVKKVPTRVVSVLGTPFGIKMYADGVMVVGMSEVDAESGDLSPAKNAGIEIGDIIVSVAGMSVSTNEELAAAVESSGGNKIAIVIKRNGERKTLFLTPAFSKSEKCYRIGLWVRDSSAGIGTLTFYDPTTNVVAGLGHGIADRTTGDIIPLLSGEMVGAEIVGLQKSQNGSPGELQGRFTGTKVGSLFVNSSVGVYGTAQSVYATDRLYPIALRQQVKNGEAKILTTIEGKTPEFYDCKIDKIYLSDDGDSKSMTVTITDSRLIDKTGGIVQGMSGSPIIQDGKLIGAVTHVFINDCCRGYAVFAETMLKTAESAEQLADEKALKDAS